MNIHEGVLILMRKKPMFRILFIGCAVLSAIILTFSTALGAPSKEGGIEVLPDTNSIIQPAYIVGEYDGYIAVFREGESLPFEITGVPAARFSEYDRSQLKTGIIAYSNSELQTILEGYDVF